jgi:hypothetical protein
MKLNDLVKLIVDNPNKKFVTDRELEQTVMFCCESIWAKEPLFRLEKFIKELCEIERPSRINRKSENEFKAWETEDIKPGRRYSEKHTGEIWLIGYRADDHDYGDRFVSISENTGMVTSSYTKKKLIEILNKNGYIPMDLL